MTTYIYRRVSTKAQDTESQDHDLRRWSRSQEGELVWMAPEQCTGKKMERPIFTAMLAQCQPGDTIVVWRLDRLGRMAAGLTRLFADLQAKGINLVSIREGIDLNSVSGRLMANVLAAVAQFEIELKSDRQRAGIEAVRKANGGKCTWGGSKKGRKTEKVRLAEQTVRELKQQGLSAYAIGKTVGLPRGTVLRILKA